MYIGALKGVTAKAVPTREREEEGERDEPDGTMVVNQQIAMTEGDEGVEEGNEKKNTTVMRRIEEDAVRVEGAKILTSQIVIKTRNADVYKRQPLDNTQLTELS